MFSHDLKVSALSSRSTAGKVSICRLNETLEGMDVSERKANTAVQTLGRRMRYGVDDVLHGVKA